jgi:hypothetical protein
MTGWRVGRDGLLRPLILRAGLAFWAHQDADLWVNQRMLVTHVRRSVPGVDKDTVRDVLDDMSRGDMLVRHSPAAKRTVYRVTAKFGDPTAPGYAREVDELLTDPLPWVSASGDFYRVGRRDDVRPSAFYVATFPHHFAKQVWMRGWIHALAQGLFVEPANALRDVALASRAAAVDLLWFLWFNRDGPGAMGAAGHAFGRTPLWRAGPPADEDPRPGAVGERAEEAVRILHELCGHGHLRPVLGPPLITQVDQRLPESCVYRGLDACVARRLGFVRDPLSLADLVPDVQVPAAAFTDDLASVDPILETVEPLIRRLDERVRRTLCDHRRAWPGGFFAGGRRP